MATNLQPLDRDDYPALAEALGQAPDTAYAIHLLSRGHCTAYVLGHVSQAAAVILRPRHSTTELVGFGHNAIAVWQLLRELPRWNTISVSVDCARRLGGIIQSECHAPVSYVDDIHLILERPAPFPLNTVARLLDYSDREVLAAAPAESGAALFGSPEELLTEGVAAGAFAGDELVTLALTTARSADFANISTYTRPDFRRQGLATDAAALVCERLRAEGQTPVWIATADNSPSLRLAARLGFVEATRRRHVIAEQRSLARSAAGRERTRRLPAAQFN